MAAQAPAPPDRHVRRVQDPADCGSAAPARAGRDRIFAGQVRLLLEKATTAVAVNVVGALIVAIVLHTAVPAALLFTWVLLQLLSSTGRLILALRYRRATDRETRAGTWALRYGVGAVLSGLLWGGGGVLMIGLLAPPEQLFLVYTLGGMAVGAIAVDGSVLPVYLAFMLPALLPLDFWFLMHGDNTYLPMGLLGGVFMCALYAAARHMNTSIRDVLRLDYLRQGLVDRLRDSEQRYRALYEHNPSMCLMLDDGGIIVSANEFGAHHLGYEAGELEGRGIDDLIEGEDRQAVVDKLAQCRLPSAPVMQARFRITRRDGTVMWVSGHARAVPPIAGGTVLLVAEDVTAQKRAEDQLRAHREELHHRAQLSAFAEMASGIAHEINQPLTAIVNYARGAARRLRGGKLDPDPLIVAMEEAAAQASRAGEIVRRLRDVVRQGQARVKPVDLNNLISGVLPFAEIDARQSGTRLQVELAGQLPGTAGDSIQLEQVILNLVHNGLEAMAGIEPSARHLTIQSFLAQDGGVGVAVHDTGPGLPAGRSYENLLSPFPSSDPQGSGMGLSVSRSIIEAHGGNLGASAHPGGGTVFRFTLPRISAEADQYETMEDVAAPGADSNE